MSAFYIGQRVRIVFAMTASGQRLVGRDGVITETREDFSTGIVCYGLDIAPIFLCYESLSWAVWGAEQLEPILPPGLESPAEIAALYEPDLAVV